MSLMTSLKLSISKMSIPVEDAILAPSTEREGVKLEECNPLMSHESQSQCLSQRFPVLR